jgi:hypothetical protein
MTYERPAPFTHAAYVQKFGALTEGAATIPLRVQVLRRGVTYCGFLAGSWVSPDGLQFWTVETSTPEVARLTTLCRYVVECPNDGLCTCASQAVFSSKFATNSASAFCHARVVAPRDSLKFENLPVLSGVSCGL